MGPETAPTGGPSGRTTRRGILEVGIIVVSILIAFGLEAGWEEAQESRRQALLLEDLTTELITNRDNLVESLANQRERVANIAHLLTETTPNRIGLSPDSIWTLQRETFSNPTWDPAFGVLNLLLASGDLALLDNRELRTRLAGLPAFTADDLANQDISTNIFTDPSIVFETASILWDYTDYLEGETLVVGPMTPERERAIRFLQMASSVTEFFLPQGDEILVELDEIIELLRAL